MARRILHALSATLQRFGGAREGAAAVEFALILPLMLLLYVGSIELSDLFSADRRVTVVASTVGDLVSRMDGDIYNDDELEDFFDAAEEILAPYPTTGLKQLITCVKVNASGVARVQWSEGTPGTTERVFNTVVDLPSEITDISRNKWIIVSETEYSYRPVLGLMFKTTIPLHHVNFHLPRFGDNIVWKSGSRPAG